MSIEESDAAGGASAVSLDQQSVQEALVEMVQQSQTFMTLITSSSGVIEFASQASKGVVGYDAASMLGKDNWSLMHSDDVARVKADVAATQERGGATFSNQYRRLHREGHYVYVSGCSYLKAGRFYTQEHSIDSEIRRQSIEEKQTYIGTTAHDLKTPVAVFQSSLDLLRQSKLTEEQDGITQQAQAAVDLMQMTVDQAMEVGKLRAGEPIKPSLGSVDVRVLLDRCKTLLEGAIPTATPDVLLTTEVADDIQGQIITDRCWLWQMTMSYLTNAYRFTHAGEIKLVVALAGEQDRYLRFEVHDTGIGVEASQRDSLFVPWTGAGTAHSRALGASRLGLYSVKVKSEQLGGGCGYEPRVRPDGQQQSGSVFYFQVPYIPEGQRFENQFERMQHMTTNAVIKGDTGAQLLPEAPQQPHATSALAKKPAEPKQMSALQRTMQAARARAVSDSSSSSSSNTAPGAGAAVQPPLAPSAEADDSAAAGDADRPTALVIDDTGSVRKLLCKTLEGKGLKCDVARNGLEGLHMMRCKLYSLVLCDAFMPVMGGMECIQRFRQWEEGHIVSATSVTTTDATSATSSSSSSAETRTQRQFIVGISSYLEGFDRDSSAIDAFLSKPIDLKWLRELLRIAITHQEGTGEARAAGSGPLIAPDTRYKPEDGAVSNAM